MHCTTTASVASSTGPVTAMQSARTAGCLRSARASSSVDRTVAGSTERTRSQLTAAPLSVAVLVPPLPQRRSAIRCVRSTAFGGSAVLRRLPSASFSSRPGYSSGVRPGTCRAIFEPSSRERSPSPHDEERPRRKSIEGKVLNEDDPVFSQLEEASIRLRALEERLADLERRKTSPRSSSSPSRVSLATASESATPSMPELDTSGYLMKAPSSLEEMDALLATLMADARARALSGSDASTAHSAAADAALAQHANAHAPTHAPASPPAQQPKPKPASAPAADDGKPSKLPPKPKPSRVRTEIPRYRWTGRPFDLPAGGMHQVVRERRQRLAARLESSSDVFLQGFHWESHKQRWYKVVEKKIPLMQDLGISGVWLPPPSQSVAVEGYLPQNFYSLDSKYGSADDLKALLQGLKGAHIIPIADAVLNHRCASVQGTQQKWNRYDGLPIPWDETAICSDNHDFAGKGNKSTGCDFNAAPNIDHRNPRVRHDLRMWLKWLRNKVGFEAIRFDFAKGYAAKYAGDYIEAFQPEFSVGEFWDNMAYTGTKMHACQDAHRQRTVDWIDGAKEPTAAFDFTTKGILQEACATGEWWRLCDKEGKAPGVIGMWPARAVTFLDNHDTGSTQMHWPFPVDHLSKGYAYILTHPGVPTIFWDHVFEMGSQQRRIVQNLVKARRLAGVVSNSELVIHHADAHRGYAATIGGRLCVWLGNSHGVTAPAPDPQLAIAQAAALAAASAAAAAAATVTGAPGASGAAVAAPVPIVPLKVVEPEPEGPYRPGVEWGTPAVSGEGFRVWVLDANQLTEASRAAR